MERVEVDLTFHFFILTPDKNWRENWTEQEKWRENGMMTELTAHFPAEAGDVDRPSEYY